MNKMSAKQTLNYLEPGDYYKPVEKLFNPVEAAKLKLVPHIFPCNNKELWIAHNVMQDCVRNKINYAFIKVQGGIEVWKSKNSHNKITK
jgi:hypothetical protein